MVDWLEIATVAVGILSAFFNKAGEKFAEQFGKKIFKMVDEKFKGDREAKSTLRNFKKNPERHRSALTDILVEKVEGDPAFGKALKDLISEASPSKAPRNITQIATGNGIAQAAGDHASAVVKMSRSIFGKKTKRNS